MSEVNDVKLNLFFV